jgi:hypothetical protein
MVKASISITSSKGASALATSVLRRCVMALTVIPQFEGPYRFLSNFWDEPKPSLEHFYQSQKTLDPDWKKKILAAETPGKAKRLGRMAPLRTDWETIKLSVMERLVRKKFTSSNELSRLWSQLFRPNFKKEITIMIPSMG